MTPSTQVEMPDKLTVVLYDDGTADVQEDLYTTRYRVHTENRADRVKRILNMTKIGERKLRPDVQRNMGVADAD
jgi:hypothetical protein